MNNELNDDLKKLKTYMILGIFIFILGLLLQVFLATIPFYYYWKVNDVKDPLFGALSIGIVTVVVITLYSLRSLLFNFSEPEGVEIDENSQLAILIAEISRKVNAPRVKKIFLSDEFNAHVSTYKSFFHPINKHYLSIGIQFMAAVSDDECKSIIAHELGHLSKEHTMFSRFIYRAYNVLYDLECSLINSEGYIDRLFYKGLHLYLKKFDKLSYSIIRKHEFQADEFAASVTSPEITATMLCRTALVSDWIEDNYWKHVWRNSWQHSVPQDGIIIKACKEISLCKKVDMASYYNQAKMDRTESKDTHPSLTDRVLHIGQKVRIPDELEDNKNSLSLLGENKDSLLRKCDVYWQEEYLYEWQQEHAYMSSAVMRRDLLLKTQKVRELIYGEEVELAQLFEATQGLKSGYKHYLKIFKKDKNNKYIFFEMCRILFKLNDQRAEKLAITLTKNNNPVLILKTYNMLIDYYKKIGNKVLVEEYRGKFRQLAKLNNKRTKSTDVQEHSLSVTEVQYLKRWLKTLGNIDFALVYQVNSKEFPEYPLHRLVISTECYLEMSYINQIWSGMNFKFDFEIIDADEQEIKTIFIIKKFPKSIILGSKSDYV